MRSTLSLLLVLTFITNFAVAQTVKKPVSPKQDEKRENEAVKEAQDNLNDAQKSLREREQDVRDRLTKVRAALETRQKAASDLQKVEKRLEDEHAQSTGLASAREKFQAAQKELDSQSRPVLDQLKEQPDYRAAQDALTKAKAAIRPDPDNPAADRKAAAEAYAKATETVRKLEFAAIDKVEILRTLRTKADAAEAAVQTAKKRFDRAVEKDPELKSAKQAFDKAKQDEDKAEDAVTDAQKRLADAKGKVAQATQKLQQKKLQDARDGNKPNSKKKK